MLSWMGPVPPAVFLFCLQLVLTSVVLCLIGFANCVTGRKWEGIVEALKFWPPLYRQHPQTNFITCSLAPFGVSIRGAPSYFSVIRNASPSPKADEISCGGSCDHFRLLNVKILWKAVHGWRKSISSAAEVEGKGKQHLCGSLQFKK